MYKNNYILNPSTCTYKNGKHLESSVCHSVITCDESINVTKSFPIKTIPTSLNKKNIENFYILLTCSVFHLLPDYNITINNCY